MNPLIIVLGAAAGGAYLYKMASEKAAASAANDAAQKRVINSQVSTLTAGKAYSVQMAVDSKALGTKELVTATQVIKSTMEQLGWKLLSTPVLRNDASKAAFDKGEVSEWVFTGVWRRRDKSYIEVAPQWMGQTLIYSLPVADDPSAII
jgi:hypothetical protein